MRLTTLSKALLVLGVVVGSAAGLALALGLRADQIPSWMITIGMYKLAFIGAVGLFVVGALVGRAATREQSLTARKPANRELQGEQGDFGPSNVDDHQRARARRSEHSQ
jgi:hypothetical protein